MVTAEFIVEMSGHTKLTFRYNGHPHPGQPKKEISDWLLSIMTGQARSFPAIWWTFGLTGRGSPHSGLLTEGICAGKSGVVSDAYYVIAHTLTSQPGR